MVNKYFLLIFIFLSSLPMLAQVGIGTENPRGTLDLNDGATGTSNYGLVLPTTANPTNISNLQGGAVVKGTMIYDSTEDCIKVNLGRLWSECLGKCDVVTPPDPGQSKIPMRWTMTTEGGSIGFTYDNPESTKNQIMKDLQNKDQFGQKAGSIYKRYPYISWNKQNLNSIYYTYNDILKYETDIISHNPGNLGLEAEASTILEFVTNGGVAVMPLPATNTPLANYFLIKFDLPYDGYVGGQAAVEASYMLQTTNHADINGPFGDVRNKSVSAKITGVDYYAKIPVDKLPAGTIVYATRDNGLYATLFATGPGNRVLFYDSTGLVSGGTYHTRNPEYMVLFKNALVALMNRINKYL